MYTYKMKGIERTVFTDKDIKVVAKARALKNANEKDFNARVKLLNECMRSNIHNCKFCN